MRRLPSKDSWRDHQVGVRLLDNVLKFALIFARFVALIFSLCLLYLLDLLPWFSRFDRFARFGAFFPRTAGESTRWCDVALILFSRFALTSVFI